MMPLHLTDISVQWSQHPLEIPQLMKPQQKPLEFHDARVEAKLSKTRPIPLPVSHLRHTYSEVDLAEGMALANHREQMFFGRLVTGMRERAVHRHQQPSEHVLVGGQQQQQQQRRDLVEILGEALDIGDDVDDHDDAHSSGRAAPWPTMRLQQPHQDAEQRNRRQHRADVLNRAASDDWGWGLEGECSSSDLPDFPLLLPPAVGKGCTNPAVILDASPAVTALDCDSSSDHEDDMVFSMDL